jgi:hypothetical protein
MEAAREVLATFSPDELPTPEEQRDLVALWARERPAAHPGDDTAAHGG